MTRAMASTAILIIIVSAINLQTSLGFSFVAPPSPRFKDTKVSVDGKATVAIVPPPLQDTLSHNVTLTDYMQLPVEQYVLIPMPLGSSLSKIEDNKETYFSSKSVEDTEFELVVPTITFFKLSLTPVVYATVQPHKNRVVISSSKCILRGSPFIEKVKLNDRFDFTVKTTLTWNDALSQQTNLAQENNQNGYMNDVVENGNNSMECSITADSWINVDVDVPRPFNAIPKSVLERTANAAMKLSLKYIQANFVENLSVDYNKWATDLEYRKYRASLSEKEVVVEEDNLLVEVGDTP